MKLPADYETTVDAGVVALRRVALAVRDNAARHLDAPELWLEVRDYEGLAGRLAEKDPARWERGVADMDYTDHDLAILSNLLSDEGDGRALPFADIVALRRLHDFLRAYAGGVYATDEPAA